jgi:thiamine-monophosphate kinase
VRVGPGDDCAVVTGEGIALSSDLSVEGVHFKREWLSAMEIGSRAASAALSDLAAVAARPIGVLVALAGPEEDAGDFAVQVMQGVQSAAERAGGVVLGGDLTRSPGPVVLDVTVIGETSAPVLRSGAQPGDELWVTGELGGAGVTVARLLRGELPAPDALTAFTSPIPRIAEALWLRERAIPTAMLDLSDGLAGDAAHLAAASGVSVALERDAIPIHPAVTADTSTAGDALAYAISGGEDYELCFAATAGSVQPLVDEFEGEFGTRLTRVGVVEEGEGVFWAEAGGGREMVRRGGFQHFGGSA